MYGVRMPAQMCICAHPCMNKCAYLCIHTWRPEVNIGCLYLSYGIFLKEGLSLNLGFMSKTRLAREKTSRVPLSLLPLMLLWFEWASKISREG